MKLTEKDIDQLTAAMFIFVHAAERVVRELAQHYEAIDRDSQQYKQFVKIYGKLRADQWLRETEKQIMLQAKGNMMHRWLDAAHKLIAATDQATDVGMMSGHDGVPASDIFGAMLNDSQWMIRLFLLQGNLNPDDYIKAESAIKLLWDKNHQPVSSDLINLFRPQV